MNSEDKNSEFRIQNQKTLMLGFEAFLKIQYKSLRVRICDESIY